MLAELGVVEAVFLLPTRLEMNEDGRSNGKEKVANRNRDIRKRETKHMSLVKPNVGDVVQLKVSNFMLLAMIHLCQCLLNLWWRQCSSFLRDWKCMKMVFEWKGKRSKSA